MVGFFYYFVFLLLNSAMAWKMPAYNMTPGVTPISHEIYDLHMTVIYICAFIFIGVERFDILFGSLSS